MYEDIDAIIRFARSNIAAQKKEGKKISMELVKEIVSDICNRLGANIDQDLIINKIWESETIIVTPTDIILSDDSNHNNNWFNETEDKRDNYYWKLQKKYLDDQGFGPASINDIENTSKQIINACSSVLSEAPSHRLGMLIGDVQSGKTSNINAIVARGLDAGYKFIVVLTANSNDLRKQTQERIDEAIIGEKTDPKKIKTQKVGVSQYIEYDNNRVPKPGTNMSEDFTINKAKGLSPALIGGEPAIFVMKKNKSILTSFKEWYKNSSIQNQSDSLLLIDDEADYASINYNDPEEDPTTINSLIREILQPNLFSKNTYIAVTATPFANVFINAEANHESDDEDEVDLGSDIFPEDFIKMSISPSNHLGPDDLFDAREPYDSNYPSHWNENHKSENSRENSPIENQMLRLLPRSLNYKERDYDENPELIEDRDGLDWQHPECFPYGKRDLIQRIPESLKYTIRVFILSLAINKLEGKKSHHNMIVNVSVNQERHRELVTYINIYRNELADDIFMNSKIDETKSSFLGQFKKDYHKEFTRSKFEWIEILNILSETIKEITVEAVNSGPYGVDLYFPNLKDDETTKPISKIIVGGHMLARGITIEGLAVTYIARKANAADTLLQIGRFFGYRNDTRHISRIFLTEDVYEFYQQINRTLEELRYFIKTMNASDFRPKDFGIRIRECVGITLTSRQKQRNVRHLRLTSNIAGKRFSGHAISRENDINEKNRELFINIISKIDPKNICQNDQYFKQSGDILFREIDHSIIRKITSNFFLAELSHRLASINNQRPIIETFFDRIAELDLEHNYKKWDLIISSSKEKKAVLDEDLFNKTSLKITSAKRGSQIPDPDEDRNKNGIRTILIGGNKFDIAYPKDFCNGIKRTLLEQNGFLVPGKKSIKNPPPKIEELNYLRSNNPCIIFYSIKKKQGVSDHLENPLLSYGVFLPEIKGLTDANFEEIIYSINNTTDNLGIED